jgi:hypothetical protein
MKYQRMKTQCFQVIPVKTLEKLPEKEQNGFKQFIHTIVHMNKSFTGTGKVKIANEWIYRYEPNVSFKLCKMDNKIYQYVTLPEDQDETKESLLIRPKLKASILSDIECGRLENTDLQLSSDHLHAFAVQGSPQLAINLDKDFRAPLKQLFRSVGQEKLMYSLTMKEIKDHDSKRDELTKRLSGLDPDDKKQVMLYWSKRISKGILKRGIRYTSEIIFSDETVEKQKQFIEDVKNGPLFNKANKEVLMSDRKLAESNRFMAVEVLFLLWTEDQNNVEQFQSELQKLMNMIQGENELKVVKIDLNLKRVQKGHLQDDVPQLCLYQKELSQLLYMPSVNEIDETFHYEHEQKTEIPSYAMGYEPGAVALGKRIDTKEVFSLPRTTTETDLDDRGVPTIVSGKKGSGKSEMIINQVADTFCLAAKDIKDWRKKARSVVVADVADGKMLKNIYEMVPDWLMDRVIFLNHADLNNPIPLNSHDVINLSKTDGIEADTATAETNILIDALMDNNSTIAIDRFFKLALQASYIVGDGNIIDAMRIIEDKEYRDDIILKLDDYVFLPEELRKFDEALKKQSVKETIDNRISQLKMVQPWIDSLSQAPVEGLDFWRWINGDGGGAYLVLIYIPKRMNKQFRSFIFAHYFKKIWAMTEARELINENERKEFLVVIDELHQIFGHRVVLEVLEGVYKEARKYRARFLFTMHGWSSIKNKDIKDVIRDSDGNYAMLKGGSDMFNSLKDKFLPYTPDDFNNLMSLDYCGIFKTDIKKKTHIYMAQLMEPASVRFGKKRNINLEDFRAISNKYGRPKEEVREAMKALMKKKEEKACQEQATPEISLEDELAMITNDFDFLKAN